MATGKMAGDKQLARQYRNRHRQTKPQGSFRRRDVARSIRRVMNDGPKGTIMGPWRGGMQKHTSLMGENHNIGNLLGEGRMRSRGKSVVKASQMKKSANLNKAQEGRRGAMKRRLGLDWEKQHGLK